MNKNRHKKLIVILLLFLFINACSYVTNHMPYALHQSEENIAQIELMKYEGTPEFGRKREEFTLLAEVSKSEWHDFLQTFYGLECSKVIGDGKASEWGCLAIQITYDDGSIEFIGYTNSVYLSSAGNRYLYKEFEYEDFRMLFSRYVDESMFPDCSQYRCDH